MGIKTEINRYNYRNDGGLSILNNHLSPGSVQVKVSFWGCRAISIDGNEGSIALSYLTKKIIDVSYKCFKKGYLDQLSGFADKQKKLENESDQKMLDEISEEVENKAKHKETENHILCDLQKRGYAIEIVKRLEDLYKKTDEKIQSSKWNRFLNWICEFFSPRSDLIKANENFRAFTEAEFEKAFNEEPIKLRRDEGQPTKGICESYTSKLSKKLEKLKKVWCIERYIAKEDAVNKRLEELNQKASELN